MGDSPFVRKWGDKRKTLEKMRMDYISLEMDLLPHMDCYRLGHVLVGLRMDPMIGLGPGL